MQNFPPFFILSILPIHVNFRPRFLVKIPLHLCDLCVSVVKNLGCGLAVLGWLLVAATVEAAPLDPRTEGIVFFPRSVAYPETSFLTEINPAGIAASPGWNTSLYYNRRAGRADRYGLLMNSRPLAVGAQWIQNPAGTEPAEWFKGSVGLGWGRGAFLSGAALHFVNGSGPSGLDEFITADAGFLLRWQRLSVGVTGYDLNEPLSRALDVKPAGDLFFSTPTEDSARIRRSWKIGVGFRPFRNPTTLTADYFLHRTDFLEGTASENVYEFGVDVAIRPGVHAVGAYTTVDFGSSHQFTLGLTLKARQARMGYQGIFSRDEDDMDGKTSSRFGPALLALHLHEAAHEDAVHVKNVAAEMVVPAALPDKQGVSFLFFERSNYADFADRLRRVRENQDIHTLLVRLRPTDLSLAHVQEIREALKSIRRAGKTVVVHLESPDLKEYYLATAADRIILQSHGHLELLGLKIEGLFFKGTLDWLEVVPQFIRAGEFKGAPEQFTRKDFSESHRANLQGVVDSLFDQIVAGIAEARDLAPERVRHLIDRGFFIADEAVKEKLVDRTLTWEQARTFAREPIGKRHRHWNDQTTKKAFEDDEKWGGRPAVALVYVTGPILRGAAPEVPFLSSGAAFADSIVKSLETIRESSRIRAAVIRVNSPGGDVLASDDIWEAVRRLKEKKPVVISMGSMAASGAYYLSTATDTIVANGATLTGSIGVFYGKFTLKGLYNKLGITKDIVKRGEHADVASDYRLLTDEEIEEMRRGVNYWYDVFLGKVRDGRGIPDDRLKEVGEGRVWTGRQGIERRLIDREGGLETALDLAARAAGLDPGSGLRIVEFPPSEPLRGLLNRSWALLLDPQWRLPELGMGGFYFLAPAWLP